MDEREFVMLCDIGCRTIRWNVVSNTTSPTIKARRSRSEVWKMRRDNHSSSAHMTIRDMIAKRHVTTAVRMRVTSEHAAQ